MVFPMRSVLLFVKMKLISPIHVNIDRIGLKKWRDLMMRGFKHYFWLGALLLLITACGNPEPPKKETRITITPYEMSEKESLLISKTGIDSISFFELSASNSIEKEELQMGLEVYEDGVFKEDLLSTWGLVEETYKNEIISFGISRSEEGDPVKLMLGMPSALSTKPYTNDKIKEIQGHSFITLIGNKITLKKNEPAYLAAWIGTTTGSLRTVSGEGGKLPEGLEEAEFALLYKVVLTDQEEQ